MSRVPVSWRLVALCFMIVTSLSSAFADAIIISAYGATNTGGSAQSYSFDFTAPYSGGLFQFAKVFYTDTLGNVQGQAGTSTVTGDLPGGYVLQAFVNGDLVASMGAGCTATAALPCSSSAPYVFDTKYAAAPSGTLELKFGFTLSGNSVFTWQAAEVLSPAPEPASLLLLGSGLMGLAGYIRLKL